MKIGSIAIHSVVSVRPTDSLDKAISLMEEHNIRHLPVTSGGRVEGMISDRDLLLAVGWKLSSQRHVCGAQTAVVGPMQVAEIMSKPVFTMTPNDSIPAAARMLVDKNISAVVVAKDDKVLGIASKVDLLSHVRDLAEFEPLLNVMQNPVEKHMRVQVVSVHPDDSLEHVAVTMQEQHVHHLPIVDGDRVFGMVSDRDLRRIIGEERIEEEQFDRPIDPYLAPTPIRNLIPDRVITIAPSRSLFDASDIMANHRIGSLPVTRQDHMIGIITDTDIIRVIAKMRD
jgi:CBS domain-containing protein